MSSPSSTALNRRSKALTRLISGCDILLEVMNRTNSLPTLSKFALVHRTWTPLAYICMYRDLHLTSDEDISLFLESITARSPKSRLPTRHDRRRLVRTLRITLADRSQASRDEYIHGPAFLDLFQILPKLTTMTRIMFELHVLDKLVEYKWMTACALLMPGSVEVFMINVCFFLSSGRIIITIAGLCIQLADSKGIYAETLDHWAQLMSSMPCKTLVLMSDFPIFGAETCETQLPLLLLRAMMDRPQGQQAHPLALHRVEVWTSVHFVHITSCLHVREVTHHTAVPGWDECHLYSARWNQDSLQWEMQDTAHDVQSRVARLEVKRCVGATINPFEPTHGHCGAPRHRGRWVECEDGTLCRAEHATRPRRSSDWVHWEDNTYGRRSMGMYRPIEAQR